MASGAPDSNAAEDTCGVGWQEHLLSQEHAPVHLTQYSVT